MIARLAGWLDQRLGAAEFVRSKLTYVFPSHWSFLLGEVALYSFLVLVVTGTYLALFFEASSSEVVYDGAYAPMRGVPMSAAYASVLEISFAVRAGLLVRQIHHWAALVFVGAIVAHLCRVFFTGAFRRPRELNWLVGVTLLALALFNGFTGYSLLDDLLSGTGLAIAHAIVKSIPLVGAWAAALTFGGAFPSEQLIPRMFVMHVWVVPLLLVGLVSVHLAIVFRQKHTQFSGPGRGEGDVVGRRLWPSYAAQSAGLLFLVAAVLALLGGLVQISPVWLYGPYEPAAVTTGAQPDWYFGWLEGALRLMPPWEPRVGGVLVANPFFPGVLLPLATFAALYAWPFVEQRVSGDRAEHHLLDHPRQRPVRTAVGVSVLTFYAVLLVAGAQDVIADRLGLPLLAVVWTLRVLVLVAPATAGVVSYLWAGRSAASAQRSDSR